MYKSAPVSPAWVGLGFPQLPALTAPFNSILMYRPLEAYTHRGGNCGTSALQMESPLTFHVLVVSRGISQQI
jgi:hypothetical protein